MSLKCVQVTRQYVFLCHMNESTKCELSYAMIHGKEGNFK